jgi:hypothetical protein
MTKKKLTPPSLQERIEALHEEIDAIITAFVDEVKTRCENVPWGILKQTVIGRAGGCRCREYKIIHDRIEADKAIAAKAEKADAASPL